jgi:hypothetical protein
MTSKVLYVVVFCAFLHGSTALVPAGAGMKAGAARIDITPPEGAPLLLDGFSYRTEPFEGIHDRLFVRAIVFEADEIQGAVVVCDVLEIPDQMLDRVAATIEEETSISQERLLLVATHTHGAPTLRYGVEEGDPAQVDYTLDLEKQVLRAVKIARENLEPVRVSQGKGRANINMNRRARTDVGGWWLGYNPDGPSDKTVHVIKVDSTNGKPLALLVNYGVHGTVMGQDNREVTGDLPGVTANLVEEYLGNGAVALWTSGTAGDQSPIYRWKEDFDDSMGSLMTLGRILSEEVIRVAAEAAPVKGASIRGARETVMCPGQKRIGPVFQRDDDYQFEDADPVEIRLSLLMINNIAIAGVSGELFTLVGQRVKEESPYSSTMVVTHCNGSAAGYLPDDEAYDQVSYEISVAKVKRGCAEDVIVDGFLKLMAE